MDNINHRNFIRTRSLFAFGRAFVLVLGMCLCTARAENLVYNGDFSWQMIGTTATTSGAGAQVDTATFSNWRLFAVDATNGTSLSGTIVSNPAAAGTVMRLDYVQGGGVASNWGLDREAARMPVAYRQGYTVSFDAAHVGGSTVMQVVFPEFKSDHGFAGQQVIKTVSVTNSSLRRYTYHWTPLTNVTAEAGISFKPLLAGTNLTMSVMIGNVCVTPASVYNGSFETEASGTAVTITNKAQVIDGSTFNSWRVFSTGTTPAVDDLTATLVTNASEGLVAMRLSWVGRGGQNHALDNNEAKNPYVRYGTNYTIAFDAAYVSGSTNLAFTVQEHNASGFVSKQTTYNVAVTNPAYQSVTITNWTPLTNVTDRVVLAFKQNPSGATSHSVLLLDNVRMTPSAEDDVDLYTSRQGFAASNRIVSTSVFSWYKSDAGQLTGPWRPLEGRVNWTGETEWWKGQVKQMMTANIDVLYVHLIPSFETQRMNLFRALNQLRAEGYDVPKVAPFLDPPITWNGKPLLDVGTAAGKDELVSHYIRFFHQYYSVNQDRYADEYLARIDNRVVLDIWVVRDNLANIPSLTRQDVSSRLAAAFGQAHPVFSNGIHMVTGVAGPTLGFADEKVPQFEVTAYYHAYLHNGTTSAQLKGGYWDQNIRNPGSILKRDGGWHYTNAWNQVDRNMVRRVYIESWNEYDEGSGIYAADPGAPYIQPDSGNTNTDVWSGVSDPYEYIRTTSRGAAAFNDTPKQDAKILWHNLPARMARGESRPVRIIVRNDGDASWTAAGNYKFGEVEFLDAAMFGSGRYLLSDAQDEIAVYGGIFRGRSKTFQFNVTAPTQAGTYLTHWRMLQEHVAWFGEELALPITVDKSTALVTLSNLLQKCDGTPRVPLITTTPPGLTVNLTYNGLPAAPIAAGSYTVIGTVNDTNYVGGVTNTLVLTADPCTMMRLL